MSRYVVGALVEWTRSNLGESTVFSLKLSRSVVAYESADLDVAVVSMNDRQLQAFAQEVVRAARKRGIELDRPRRRWWHHLGVRPSQPEHA